MNVYYLPLTPLGRAFHMSPNTTRKYLSELEALPRYKGARLELTLEQRRYNVLVFADYCHYRARLRDRNMSKFVPPYDPVETAKTLGMGGINGDHT